MLLVLLTTLHHHLPPTDAHLMRSAFCCAHTHTGPNVPGWEEMVEVSMTSLLKLLGNRDNSATTNDLKFPESTKKLKKKISMVVDRMGKGGRLSNHRNLTDIPGSKERGKESEEFADDITTDDITTDDITADDITANDITADVYNGMDSLKGGFPTVEIRTPETNGFDHRYTDHKSGIYAGKAPTIPSGNIEENDAPKYDTTHSSDSLNEIESPAFYDDYSLLT
uniref:PTHB1 C-terminal helix bundle domain-containing protein n=1 Tax=Ciona savignyi TaxID=51511 RepID=H2YQG8_CIOSA